MGHAGLCSDAMQSVVWLCTFAWDVVRSAKRRKGHVMQWCTWCVGAWVVFGCEQQAVWDRMLMSLFVGVKVVVCC